MPDLPKTGIEYVAETSKAERNIAGLIGDLTRLERQFTDAAATAKAMDASLDSVGGDIDVKVSIDSSEVGTVQQTLEGLAQDTGIKILADDAELIAAQGIIEQIDAAAPGVKVNTDDAELDTAKDKVDDIDSAAPNVKIKGDDSDVAQAIGRVEDELNKLQNLAKIDILLSLPANIDALAQRLLDLPIISTLNDIDQATQRIVGRTGREIPEAAGIIERIYTAAWGGSREEVADLLIETSRLGVANDDLESTMLAVYRTADVTGGDAVETLRAMEQLVANGIVPSFTDAGDIIAFGFQNGLDQGGDFLDTLIEYAPQFKEAGLSMETMFNILRQGAEGGAFNLDKMADGFKEMANLTREEVTALSEFGTATDRTTALEEIGFLDEAEAFASGKMSGDEYVAGLMDALRAVEDPAQQGLLTKYIFGPTQAEEITVSTLLGIDLTEELPNEMEGAAKAGSDAFNNTLETTVTGFSRTIESELTKAINKALNIDGVIDEWKVKIQTFASELGSGTGLLESIEIGLAIPGFADAVGRFEASVGEFLISVLELIAGVQDFLGKDSSTTRGQIAGLAETQLAFNLKVANPDEIQGEIDRAVSRGVSQDAITSALTAAGQELIAEGNLERAQQIVDTFAEVQYVIAPGLDQIKTAAAEIAIRGIEDGTLTQEMIDNAVGEGFIIPVGIDQSGLQEQIDSANLWNDAFSQIQEAADNDSYINNMMGNARASQTFVEAADEANAVVSALPEFGNISDQLGLDETAVSEQESLWDRVNSAVQQTMSTDVPQAVDAGAKAVEDADNRIAMAMTGNTMTTSFETVANVANATMKQMQTVVEASITKMVAAEVMFTNQTNILKGALLGLLGEVGPGIIDLATNLQNIAAGASVAAQTITAANAASKAATIEENAAGGQFSGMSWVGEAGPELVSSDKTLSVLNNRTSDAFMTGFGMGAIQGGIQTTNNYITINQSNNLASGAALGNQRFSVGRQIRGL